MPSADEGLEMGQSPRRASRSAEQADLPSGRLLLRMPRPLHGELARAAERDGVSLNQLITDTLARSIGWAEEGTSGVPAVRPQRERRSSRLIGLALAANFVVVLIAGLAAIGLLIAAWQAAG